MTTTLRPLCIAALMSSLTAAGCAPANYLYAFDITDPGAVNYKDSRRPDAMDDPDIKLEVRADPGEFRAVALEVTNKTDVMMQPQWDQISIVGPDQMQRPLRPSAAVGDVEPRAKVKVLLAPFELPTQGPEAKGYDGTTFELVIPVVIRGSLRPYRIHLQAKLKKI